MADAREREAEREAAGGGPDETARLERERCRQGDHAWTASFLESGLLASWGCPGCGARRVVREPTLGDPLSIAYWDRTPALLTVRGLRPPICSRRWRTRSGWVLVEIEPNGTDFLGAEIPGLTEAFAYELRDGEGQVLETYQGQRIRLSPNGDSYRLIRYRVEGTALMQFGSHCHEESSFDIPSASEPSRTEVLPGLEPVE